MKKSVAKMLIRTDSGGPCTPSGLDQAAGGSIGELFEFRAKSHDDPLDGDFPITCSSFGVGVGYMHSKIRQ